MRWSIDRVAVFPFTRVRLEGDLDLYAATAFAKEMLGLVAGGEMTMEIDATSLSYLDSSGVGAIIRILKAARERGAAVRWRGLRGMPRKVLGMANILPLMREAKEEGT